MALAAALASGASAFQFLIGSMKLVASVFATAAAWFQFLIGSMKLPALKGKYKGMHSFNSL